MAVNDLSPGFAKIFYQSGTNQHVMTVPVKPIAPDPLTTGNEVENYAGVGVEFGQAINTLVTALRPFHNTATDFTLAELWSKPTPESDPIFIEIVEVGLQGSASQPVIPFGQVVLTYRTQFGGLFKIYQMSTVVPPNTILTAPYPVGAQKTLSDYLKGVDSVWYGRDNGKIVAPIRQVSKLNDALRKRALGV